MPYYMWTCCGYRNPCGAAIHTGERRRSTSRNREECGKMFMSPQKAHISSTRRLQSGLSSTSAWSKGWSPNTPFTLASSRPGVISGEEDGDHELMVVWWSVCRIGWQAIVDAEHRLFPMSWSCQLCDSPWFPVNLHMVCQSLGNYWFVPLKSKNVH